MHVIGINPQTVLEDGYERPIHQLRSHMGMEWRIQLKRPPSKVSVNMKYKAAGLEIDADILVSPNWDSKEDLYDFLTTAKRTGASSAQLFRWDLTVHNSIYSTIKRYIYLLIIVFKSNNRFSINASKWQVEFILKQDEKVSCVQVKPNVKLIQTGQGAHPQGQGLEEWGVARWSVLYREAQVLSYLNTCVESVQKGKEYTISSWNY